MCQRNRIHVTNPWKCNLHENRLYQQIFSATSFPASLCLSRSCGWPRLVLLFTLIHFSSMRRVKTEQHGEKRLMEGGKSKNRPEILVARGGVVWELKPHKKNNFAVGEEIRKREGGEEREGWRQLVFGLVSGIEMSGGKKKNTPKLHKMSSHSFFSLTRFHKSFFFFF